jgi:hypothetical protein
MHSLHCLHFLDHLLEPKKRVQGACLGGELSLRTVPDVDNSQGYYTFGVLVQCDMAMACTSVGSLEQNQNQGSQQKAMACTVSKPDHE